MKLSEKILYCRKKLGNSQEALAEKLGVSRQAVSKWETGESEPEIGKLRMMSQIFHVSVDWLLSEDEPAEAAPDASSAQTEPQWLEHLPKYLRRSIYRYGWLGGLIISLHGLVLAVAGGVIRWLSGRMMAANLAVWAADPSGVSEQLPVNPAGTLFGIVMAVGLVMIAAGVIVSLLLRRRFK